MKTYLKDKPCYLWKRENLCKEEYKRNQACISGHKLLKYDMICYIPKYCIIKAILDHRLFFFAPNHNHKGPETNKVLAESLKYFLDQPLGLPVML